MSPNPNELFVIETLLAGAPSTQATLQVPPGDDAAVLKQGEVITTDAFLEGVHFSSDTPPEAVGWKTIAASVSDVGAMGGTPHWCTLSLSIVDPINTAWIQRFRDGLHKALRHFRVDLIGGDTTRSPGPAVVVVTVGGHVEQAVQRNGAKVGDHIWVTGTLGDASLGFFHGGPSLQALHYPLPPIEFAAALGQSGWVTGMMDLSDGLHQDLQRLCASSRVGAEIDERLLPMSEPMKSAHNAIAHQVAFGEDYQLLFTAPQQHRESILALAHTHNEMATQIGMVLEGTAPKLKSQAWPGPLFQHFQNPRK